MFVSSLWGKRTRPLGAMFFAEQEKEFRHGSKTGTGTSPEPVFWVVVESGLGGESPFLNHARFSADVLDRSGRQNPGKPAASRSDQTGVGEGTEHGTDLGTDGKVRSHRDAVRSSSVRAYPASTERLSA